VIYVIRKNTKESRNSGLTNAKTELIKVHFRSKKEPNIAFGSFFEYK